MKPDVALFACPLRKKTAERMARTFNLPLGDKLSKTTYQLRLGEERLALHDTRPGAPGPVYADFVAGPARHRRMFGGGRKQPLARAVGLKGHAPPRVVDCTAGLGRDAFVLATLGCDVTLVERSPVLAALLYDALERAAINSETAAITAAMSLIHQDAIDYLHQLGDESRPDTVYMDPMYPHRIKSALVRKEMRVARDLVGDDDDAPQLLDQARQVALKRVVVKRPSTAPALSGPPPDTSINSRKTRYDIYLMRQGKG